VEQEGSELREARMRANMNIPATFSLNWSHCENGTAHPEECECTIYMGPPTSEQAGQGSQWPEVDGSVLVFVAERLRTCGMSVTILPEDFDEDEEQRTENLDGSDIDGSRKRQKTETKTLRELELAFFRSDRYNFDAMKAFDADDKLVAAFRNMSLDKAWICITIINNEMSDQIYDVLRSDFELATFPHVIEDVPIDTSRVDLTSASFRLEAVTGDERGSETKVYLSTLFSLHFQQVEGNNLREKLVAKALCSYSYCNAEMNSVDR
jgi:hypothetical protein